MPEQAEQNYTNQYAISHPVKSRYDRLLSALADAAKYEMLISQGLMAPGEGRGARSSSKDALMDASLLEAEIAGGYFKPEDFKAVFPAFDARRIFSQLMGETLSVDLLNARAVLIKKICETNHWFEDEGHRMTASEIPEF